MTTKVENRRIEELRRRVQSDPASVAFAALAHEFLSAGQFDDAIATCLLGLKRHPSYLSARVTLGRALSLAGRFDEAEAEFERVLQTAPENLSARQALAEIHDRRERPLQAIVPPEDPQIRALETFLSALASARRAGGDPSS